MPIVCRRAGIRVCVCVCDIREISFGLVIPHHLHFRRTEMEREREKENKVTINVIIVSSHLSYLRLCCRLTCLRIILHLSYKFFEAVDFLRNFLYPLNTLKKFIDKCNVILIVCIQLTVISYVEGLQIYLVLALLFHGTLPSIWSILTFDLIRA